MSLSTTEKTTIITAVVGTILTGGLGLSVIGPIAALLIGGGFFAADKFETIQHDLGNRAGQWDDTAKAMLQELVVVGNQWNIDARKAATEFANRIAAWDERAKTLTTYVVSRAERWNTELRTVAVEAVKRLSDWEVNIVASAGVLFERVKEWDDIAKGLSVITAATSLYWFTSSVPDNAAISTIRITLLLLLAHGAALSIKVLGPKIYPMVTPKVIAEPPPVIAELPTENAETYRQSGMANSEKGEYEAAIADFSLALKIAPDSETLYFERGEAKFMLQLYKSALQDFTKAIELSHNKNADAFWARADLYFQLGEYEAAIADCNRALELVPNRAAYFLSRAESQIRLGKLEEARLDLDKTSEMPKLPNNSIRHIYRLATAHHTIADCLMEKNKYDLAIKQYLSALNNYNLLMSKKSDDEIIFMSACAKHCLGHCFMKIKKRAAGLQHFRDAIKDYTLLIQHQSSNAELYHRRGDLRRVIGEDLAGAKADYEHALAINPILHAAKKSLAALDSAGKWAFMHFIDETLKEITLGFRR